MKQLWLNVEAIMEMPHGAVLAVATKRLLQSIAIAVAICIFFLNCIFVAIWKIKLMFTLNLH